MRHQGRITHWKDDKGFGFITPNGGGARVFVHINSFSQRQRRPVGNEIVTYELRVDGKGSAQAAAVSFVGERAPQRESSAPGRSPVPPLFAACFLLAVAVAAFVGRLPAALLALYVVASVVSFALYAVDKSAALNNGWRTRESTLHLLALAGGWPGALAAQRMLRHKSSKASFQSVFWFTVLLNCCALVWLLSPLGSTALLSLREAV